jgi:hypothetical protein
MAEQPLQPLQHHQQHVILQHHVATPGTLHLSLAGHRVVMTVISPEELRAGAIVQPDPWMVRHIIEHPDEIRNLSRRQFQEFSAALLERKGLKVTLGPIGADGGVDVRAERDGEFGPELILVQAKHPDSGNKVGIETVKLLHYQVLQEGATRGLVMTDSTFTRYALQQIAAYRFQMDGADGDRIRKWLEALRTGAPVAEGRP